MLRTYKDSYTLSISIHTPVKGVTVERIDDDLFKNISIHTPVKGVT